MLVRGVAMNVGEAGSIWAISVPSSQLCCDPKSAQKLKLLKKNMKIKKSTYSMGEKISEG